MWHVGGGSDGGSEGSARLYGGQQAPGGIVGDARNLST